MKQIIMLAFMCMLCLFAVTGCAETGTEVPDTRNIAETTVTAEETKDTTTQTTQTETTTTGTTTTMTAETTTTEPETTITTTETTTTTVQTTVTTEAPETEAPEPPETEPEEAPVQTDPPSSLLITSDGYYILNTSKLTIHRPSCSAIHTMNEENKQEYYGTVEELEAQGYHCCGRCHPR